MGEIKRALSVPSSCVCTLNVRTTPVPNEPWSFEAVGPTQLKTLVDIGNFEPLLSMQMAVMQGQEPPTTLDTTPLYGAIAQIAPYAGLVHAKTHGFDQQGRPLHMDVVRALRVVRDSGFAGPISLEYEGSEGDAWENTRRTRALVEEAFA